MNNRQQNGFTLIELMVATSIFVIVMLSSMSSLFMLLDTGKNSRGLRFAMDNVNFAMESMTRSIRMGTNYYCGIANTYVNLSDLDSFQDGNNCTLIAFKPSSQSASQKVAYQLSDGAIQMNSGGSWIPITSSNVNIENLKFFTEGSSPSDSIQASVYIIMKGTVTIKGVPTSFSVQTLASQRNF